MQKIVTIGGGTGHYQTLRGLKHRDCSLTAVVNVCDNGGHSGDLRDEYGVLPPGDVRQCILALSKEENYWREIFDDRFHGKSLGNLIIASLEKNHGRVEGLRRAGKLLETRGSVLYASLDDFHIFAELEDGTKLKGQKQVSYPKSKSRIKKVVAEPIPCVNGDAAEAIRQADKVVICPGDLYGSIISNFLIKGLTEAISESDADIVYVCNIVTKAGSRRYKASEFVSEIEKYLDLPLHKIIINTKQPRQEVLEKYLAEDSVLVEDDLDNDQRVIRKELSEPFVSEGQSGIKTILRHEPTLTSNAIMTA